MPHLIFDCDGVLADSDDLQLDLTSWFADIRFDAN